MQAVKRTKNKNYYAIKKQKLENHIKSVYARANYFEEQLWKPIINRNDLIDE